MNFIQQLDASVEKSNSLLCVGLDPELDKLPEHIRNAPQPLYAFNSAIIDATHDIVSSYKPNSAFYEAQGADGIAQLKSTMEYVGKKYPEIPVILDAKRADIGNTNRMYAKFAFDYLGADAITLHPYVGKEGLEVFLSYKDKGCIILCRTSNPGAGELQDVLVNGKKFYLHVAELVSKRWNEQGNCLLVVGATYPSELREIRVLVGDSMTLLVPGIGAQGGSVEESIRAGLNSKKTGMIVSTSRVVLYASSGRDFAERAREKAAKLRDEINKYR